MGRREPFDAQKTDIILWFQKKREQEIE